MCYKCINDEMSIFVLCCIYVIGSATLTCGSSTVVPRVHNLFIYYVLLVVRTCSILCDSIYDACFVLPQDCIIQVVPEFVYVLLLTSSGSIGNGTLTNKSFEIY